MLLIAQLKGHLAKLEVYQTDNTLRDKNDLILLVDLIRTVQSAIKDKHNDWQISFAEISQIQLHCTTFNNPLLTNLVMKEIFSLCELVFAERKKLAVAILDFVCDCKVVRDPNRLNIDSYPPDIISHLRFILKCDDVTTFIRQTDFDQLFSAIKSANIFSETDLKAWSTLQTAALETLFKGLIISEKAIESKRFEAGTYKMDPLVLERIQRRALYLKTNSVPNSPTRPMTPLIRNAHSLPSTPKKTEDVQLTSVPPLLLSTVGFSATPITRTREDLKLDEKKVQLPPETSAFERNKPL